MPKESIYPVEMYPLAHGLRMGIYLHAHVPFFLVLHHTIPCQTPMDKNFHIVLLLQRQLVSSELEQGTICVCVCA